MGRRALMIVLAVLPFTAYSRVGQKTAVPPRPTALDPELALTMKALEAKLSSVSRVTWTATIGEQKQKVALFEEMSSVSADPKDCRLRFRLTGIEDFGFFGLEELYLVEVQFVEVRPGPDSAFYAVSGSAWFPFDFKFSSKEVAEQVAALLRQAVKQCSARPRAPQPSNGSGPTLDETLSFAADKINTQGNVSWVATLKNTATGRMLSDISYSEGYSASPNPATCTMILHDLKHPDITRQLSFRRTANIEVMPWTEAEDRFEARVGHAVVSTASPIIYDLIFHTPIEHPGGFYRSISFADELVANRVAKAMVHAAELCGAGVSNEPF